MHVPLLLLLPLGSIALAMILTRASTATFKAVDTLSSNHTSNFTDSATHSPRHNGHIHLVHRPQNFSNTNPPRTNDPNTTVPNPLPTCTLSPVMSDNYSAMMAGISITLAFALIVALTLYILERRKLVRERKAWAASHVRRGDGLEGDDGTRKGSARDIRLHNEGAETWNMNEMAGLNISVIEFA
jgi:hypothetical protein